MINTKETRRNALKWWRALPEKEKRQIVEKHFKNIDFILVSTSSIRIEKMFQQEFKLNITTKGKDDD